jgi:hypothetical protein
MKAGAQVVDVRAGRCLCGGVRFRAGLTSFSFGACHCDMCRRWVGSALLAISVPTDNIHWDGHANIARFQSSSWAERANCKVCGTALFYRVTSDGPGAGDTELPIGLFDSADGLTFDSEIYIDLKPDSFAYAGDRKRMTRAQTHEHFGLSVEGDLT